MRHRMLQAWNKPYPVQADWKHLALTACMTGVFIWLFLLFFQPFGLHQISEASKPLLLAGYGVITALVMFFHGVCLHFYMAQDYRREVHWTVGRQVVYILSQITLIALANFFYSASLGLMEFSLESFLFYTLVTFVIGIFPTVALVLFAYIRHLRKHMATAAATNSQLMQQSNEAVKPEADLQAIRLQGENKDELVKINSCNLLYISAAGNYAEIAWIKEGMLQKTLLRSSLSRLEEQLQGTEAIMRCHRSYLVNLQQVKEVKGNAQGYQLHLKSADQSVPLSRSFAPYLLQKISAVV